MTNQIKNCTLGKKKEFEFSVYLPLKHLPSMLLQKAKYILFIFCNFTDALYTIIKHFTIITINSENIFDLEIYISGGGI